MSLKAESLPPHCGYPWPKDNRRFQTGCGCGEEFTSHHQVYRCVDCGVAMHRNCLTWHFGDGKDHDLGPEYGKVRSPHHSAHTFAFQIAYLAEVAADLDQKLKALQCDIPVAPSSPE